MIEKPTIGLIPVGYVDQYGNFELLASDWMKEEPEIIWKPVFFDAQKPFEHPWPNSRAPAAPVVQGEPARSMPYNPTAAMLHAAQRIDPALRLEDIRALWAVMWAAAPSPAPAAQDATAGDVRPIHRECAMFDLHDRCDECRSAPAAPVAQPVSEPSDEQIINACASVGLGPNLGLQAGRAVLALRPVAPRAPLTDEQIVAAARAMNKLASDACNVDEGDSWSLYGNSYIIDAAVVLKAACGVRKEGGAA